jgi:hypothetical protein
MSGVFLYQHFILSSLKERMGIDMKNSFIRMNLYVPQRKDLRP